MYAVAAAVPNLLLYYVSDVKLCISLFLGRLLPFYSVNPVTLNNVILPRATCVTLAITTRRLLYGA